MSSFHDRRELVANLHVSSAPTAYRFWRTALPRAGYTVRKSEFITGFGEIRLPWARMRRQQPAGDQSPQGHPAVRSRLS